jgi:hypothetical protein
VTHLVTTEPLAPFINLLFSLSLPVITFISNFKVVLVSSSYLFLTLV